MSKTHAINIALDRNYTLDEIKTFKIEFDYYHTEKREQNKKGMPKVQLLYNDVGKGSSQGGGQTTNDKSPFICTDIDENWWHLEYFITSLCPYLADHQDSALPLTQKFNGIKITDTDVYDHDGRTAFAVIDNLVFGSEPTSRLGLFNRTTSYSVDTYYWFKVAWSGELHSCVITTSDPTIAIQDTESTKSPFYIKGLKAGSFTATAILVVGDNRRVLSISNTLTVN